MRYSHHLGNGRRVVSRRNRHLGNEQQVVIRYKALSGKRSGHQRCRVISDFPRFADVTRGDRFRGNFEPTLPYPAIPLLIAAGT
jgi:hypothetical protein